MLTFIDISGWQPTLNADAVYPNVDAVIAKATEGIGYVEKYCDPFVQAAIKQNKPWGFYHYGRNNNATKEADYFYANCKNYFGCGIPILDWEEGQSVDWVNTFVRRIHDLSNVWPWIYSNKSNFNKGGVEQNCGRWIAAWPFGTNPTFDMAKTHTAPTCDGLVCAWQFCSNGRVSGYSGDLDCDIFYGDVSAWNKYVKGDTNSTVASDTSDNTASVLENDEYKVTIERK